MGWSNSFNGGNIAKTFISSLPWRMLRFHALPKATSDLYRATQSVFSSIYRTCEDAGGDGSHDAHEEEAHGHEPAVLVVPEREECQQRGRDVEGEGGDKGPEEDAVPHLCGEKGREAGSGPPARRGREDPAPSRPRGGENTWEGGERAGVGGGAVAHAGHQAEAEDLLQEAPAAARLAALHPLSGPAAAIRWLLFRPPPSARSSQWETSHDDRQFSPPIAARQGASGPPRPVPTPHAAMGTAVGRKECREHPGNGSSRRRAGRCYRLGGRSSPLAALSLLLPVLGAAYRGSAVFQPARGRPGRGGDTLGRGGDTLGRGGRA